MDADADKEGQVKKSWLNLQEELQHLFKVQETILERIKPICSSPKEQEGAKEAVDSKSRQRIDSLCPFAAELYALTEEIFKARTRAYDWLQRIEI